MDPSASEAALATLSEVLTKAIRDLAAVANKGSAQSSSGPIPATPSSASTLSLPHTTSFSGGSAPLGSIANYPTHGVLQGVNIPPGNSTWPVQGFGEGLDAVQTPNRYSTQNPEASEMIHPPSYIKRLQSVNRGNGIGAPKGLSRSGSSVIASLIGFQQFQFGGKHEFDLIWDLCESMGAVVACSPIAREDGPAEVQKAVRAAFSDYTSLLVNHGFSWAALSRTQTYFISHGDSGGISGQHLSEIYVKQPCAIIYSNSNHPGMDFSRRVREIVAPSPQDDALVESDGLMVACSKCGNLFDSDVVNDHERACSKKRKNKREPFGNATIAVKAEPKTPTPFAYDGMNPDRPIEIPGSNDGTPLAKRSRTEGSGKDKRRAAPKTQDPLSDIFEGEAALSGTEQDSDNGEYDGSHAAQKLILSMFGENELDFIPTHLPSRDDEQLLASSSVAAPVTGSSSQSNRRATRSTSKAPVLPSDL
ncbi:hypothetical protein TREMEDRAFT_61790 [Tremella mesenterica DSM 1558]|uniref:uncharacterized protein n=1 Tax=Tremella mesenterica (strain ATCC 24925 / CBS 8224 / DSM 1558 / NBRC 9311 / NRRL Y-6157 / RJB 2259-6 / UBC 559-6) TaxID=578456 RepID=UPI0003F4945C|nr:uncharacterized protein TREMEDRAFT_61790 [Tremella mesenterica DSM 1558]EIW70027.1 hypothetical protein TREMEDRAFT_61790 [Tremella mesenterica DSM 1558]